MRIIPGLLISLFLIMLTGCLQSTNFSDVEPRLKEWDKSHEYGRLLDTLSRIDPRDPDYTRAASLRKQVEKRAADYERRVRTETEQKLDKGNWALALDQYDEALGKYPRSAILKDGLARLRQLQQESIDELEKKLLIQRGQWLRDVLPVYRDIARVDPRGNQAQSQLNRIIREAVKISSELALLGDKALADNDLEIAQETIPLAVSLNKDPVIQQSLEILRTRQRLSTTRQLELDRLRQKKAQEKLEKQQRGLRDLVKRHDKAFAAKDFITARKHLIAIESLDRGYSRLAAMKAKLKSATEGEVTRLFNTGVSAYSRGDYEQAAKAWRAALKLDANHQQARENLQRAEKVLEKLESLKLKQGS